jgi:glycosyltransferase involved in cell wall biosynthesis
MKAVGIAETARGAKAIARELWKDSAFVAASSEAQKAFSEAGYSCRHWKEFFSARDFDEIDARAVSIAGRWFNETGLVYEGVSLGRLVEYEAMLWLTGLLKKISFAQNLGKKIGFDVVFCEGGWGKVFKTVFPEKRAFTTVAQKPFHAHPREAAEYFVKHLLSLARTLSKKPSARSAVFFYVNDPAIMLPAIKALERKERVGVMGSGWSAQKAFLGAGISFTVLEDYASGRTVAEVEEGEKWLEKKWSELKDSRNFAKSFEFRGTSFMELAEERLRLFFERDFVKCMQEIGLAKEFFRREEPKAIVLATDSLARERALVFAAKKFRVPSIVLQHGIPSHFKHTSYRELAADELIAWGRKSKELFKRHGISGKKILVAGNPKFDSYVRKPVRDKRGLCKKLGLNPDRKIVVLATQPFYQISSAVFPEERIEFIASAAEAVEKTGAQLVVKVHPSDSVEEVRELAGNAVVEKRIDLNSLLNACDALIVHNSGIAVEAMIVGKPVLVVNLTRRKDVVPYVEEGAAFGVYEKNKLVESVKKVLGDGKLRKRLAGGGRRFVKEYAFSADGRASERVAQSIEAIVSKHLKHLHARAAKPSRDR